MPELHYDGRAKESQAAQGLLSLLILATDAPQVLRVLADALPQRGDMEPLAARFLAGIPRAAEAYRALHEPPQEGEWAPPPEFAPRLCDLLEAGRDYFAEALEVAKTEGWRMQAAMHLVWRGLAVMDADGSVSMKGRGP